jgi:hypothetical protein
MHRRSLEMPVRRTTYLRVLDIDDGYDRPAWLNTIHKVASPAFVPLCAVLRAVRPLRA